jgi:glycerol uptake facilitator-like aquaporin
MDLRHLFAEFSGTLIFVFSYASGKGEAFAAGSGLLIAYSVTSIISGGHFNPAVTLSFALSKLIARTTNSAELLKFTVYVILQFLGALCGALLAWAVTDFTHEIEFGDDTDNGQAWIGEMVITAMY